MSDLSIQDTDDLYRVFVLHADPVRPYGRPSCAMTLLALWDCPWSPTALRYAYHALQTALQCGCDVLEVYE